MLQCPESKKVLKGLFLIISVLLGLHLITLGVWDFLEGKKGTHFLLRVFHFHKEANIPTYFSTLQLLGSGVLVLLITLREKARRHSWVWWAGLSATFFFLSTDEFIQIHELFSAPLREALNLSGALGSGWILVYGTALVLFCGAYARFFFALPNSTKRRLCLSALFLVGGAIGFEILTFYILPFEGHSVRFQLINACEELLEMMGGALFIYTWLCHIEESGGLRILIGGEAKEKLIAHPDAGPL